MGKIVVYENEVTQCVPNQFIEIKMTGGSFGEGEAMFVSYSIMEYDDEHVQLVMAAKMDVESFFVRVMLWLMKYAMDKQSMGFLRNLKMLVEEGRVEVFVDEYGKFMKRFFMGVVVLVVGVVVGFLYF